MAVVVCLDKGFEGWEARAPVELFRPCATRKASYYAETLQMEDLQLCVVRLVQPEASCSVACCVAMLVQVFNCKLGCAAGLVKIWCFWRNKYCLTLGHKLYHLLMFLCYRNTSKESWYVLLRCAVQPSPNNL